MCQGNPANEIRRTTPEKTASAPMNASAPSAAPTFVVATSADADAHNSEGMTPLMPFLPVGTCAGTSLSIAMVQDQQVVDEEVQHARHQAAP
jgi:hypothetical protein